MEEELGKLIVSPQPLDRNLLMLVNPLKLALQSEHDKNEALLSEREYLLELMELRRENYAERQSLRDWQIETMKSEEEQMRKYNSAKLECLLDIKEREVSSSKTDAELAEKNLQEAQTRIAALHAENKALKKFQSKMEASLVEKDSIISKKEDTLSRWKGECEKLKEMMKEKDQIISGLHADVAKFASRASPKCSNQVDRGTSRTLRKRAHE